MIFDYNFLTQSVQDFKHNFLLTDNYPVLREYNRMDMTFAAIDSDFTAGGIILNFHQKSPPSLRNVIHYLVGYSSFLNFLLIVIIYFVFIDNRTEVLIAHVAVDGSTFAEQNILGREEQDICRG